MLTVVGPDVNIILSILLILKMTLVVRHRQTNSIHSLISSVAISGLLLSSGCTTENVAPQSPPSQAETNTDQMQQGIQGRFTKLSGNFMPRISDDATSDSSTASVSTNIWVFSSRVKSDVPTPQWISIADAQNHPQFIMVIPTDENGEFSIGLEPGIYTLFTESDELLYLNSFDGEGYYSSVEVTEGATNFVELVNSEDAVF